MKMKNCFAGRLARFSVVNRRLLAVALLSVSLLGVKAQGDADAKYAADLLRPGTEAPDFVVANAGADYDGTSLSSLRGKYVVLDFWASWCPDCRKDIKKIRWMNHYFASDSIVFIGMSFDKTEEAWRKCVADSAMTWMQHREEKPWKETQVAKDYHVNWIPTIYLIGPDGRVKLGTVVANKLRRTLETIAPEAVANRKKAPRKDGGAPDGAKMLSEADLDRFPGGGEALKKYVHRNIQYPEMAHNLQAAGHVMMLYTLNPDGSITDITATDCKLTYVNTTALAKYTTEQQAEIRKECMRQFAKEGYRIFKNMPKWKEAKDGRPVKGMYRLNFGGVEFMER